MPENGPHMFCLSPPVRCNARQTCACTQLKHVSVRQRERIGVHKVGQQHSRAPLPMCKDRRYIGSRHPHFDRLGQGGDRAGKGRLRIVFHQVSRISQRRMRFRRQHTSHRAREEKCWMKKEQ